MERGGLLKTKMEWRIFLIGLGIFLTFSIASFLHYNYFKENNDTHIEYTDCTDKFGYKMVNVTCAKEVYDDERFNGTWGMNFGMLGLLFFLLSLIGFAVILIGISTPRFVEYGTFNDTKRRGSKHKN